MRIQLVVSETQYSLMEDLKEKTGASTIKELLNNALTLLNWAVGVAMEGASVCAIDEQSNVYKELQMPALVHAAQSVAKQPGSAQSAKAKTATKSASA